MSITANTTLDARITLAGVSYPSLAPDGYCGGRGCCGSDEACDNGSHGHGHRCRCSPTPAYGDPRRDAFDDSEPTLHLDEYCDGADRGFGEVRQ